MPKQIIVANKSRKQTIKVNFRQSPFTEWVAQVPTRASKTSDMDPIGPPILEFTQESVECMTFPGPALQFTYSSGCKGCPV